MNRLTKISTPEFILLFGGLLWAEFAFKKSSGLLTMAWHIPHIISRSNAPVME
ncbi:hypothetical protein H8E88_00255 [candidate division KSB1 bacterium]|nr:hypothetical protein [candidate division KSB1 bacterium]